MKIFCWKVTNFVFPSAMCLSAVSFYFVSFVVIFFFLSCSLSRVVIHSLSILICAYARAYTHNLLCKQNRQNKHTSTHNPNHVRRKLRSYHTFFKSHCERDYHSNEYTYPFHKYLQPPLDFFPRDPYTSWTSRWPCKWPKASHRSCQSPHSTLSVDPRAHTNDKTTRRLPLSPLDT